MTDIINGVMVATVTDNNDKKKLGRIKIQYPSFSGDKIEYWAPSAVLMAGKGTGTFFLPEVGEQVLVAFEYGDVTRPFIIGSIWSKQTEPPEENSGDKNNIRVIKSRSGHIIRFDDTDSGEKIEIIDKSGKNSIILDTSANTVTIKSEKDILLDAPNGDVKIKAKNIKLTADEKTESTSGKETKLDGGAKTVIKGSKVDIN